MKLSASDAAGAIDRPDHNARLFLLSGSDNSASRLLAQRLQRALGAEKIAVTGAQLKADPGWLSDEAASLSMFGDKRLLWIEPAGEEILPAVTALLDLPAVESPTVAIFGNAFRSNSALAKLANGHPLVRHIVSEPLSLRDAVRAVMEFGTAEGLQIAPTLAERIVTEAAGDLMLARLELQKFALYLDASPDSPTQLDEEVLDLLGIDQAEGDIGRPGDLALAGDLPALADELALLDSCAIEPIPVVRALQRRLLMLAPLTARVAKGQRPDSVLQSVWKRDQKAVRRILPLWSPERLGEAFARVQKLERELLLSPVPGRAALGETLLQLARAARR